MELTHGQHVDLWTCSSLKAAHRKPVLETFIRNSGVGSAWPLHSEGPNTKMMDARCIQLTLINSSRHDESGSRQTRQGSFQIWHRRWLRNQDQKQKGRRRKGKPALQVPGKLTIQTIMAAKSQTDSGWKLYKTTPTIRRQDNLLKGQKSAQI